MTADEADVVRELVAATRVVTDELGPALDILRAVEQGLPPVDHVTALGELARHVERAWDAAVWIRNRWTP